MRHEDEQKELEILREIRDTLRRILHLVTPRLSASLTIGGTVPATITVGKTATAQWQEWSGPNGTGDKLSPAGQVNFSSSDTNIATVDANGLVTGVAAGTATISGTDAANNLTASDSLTVQAVQEVAQSATLTLVAN